MLRAGQNLRNYAIACGSSARIGTGESSTTRSRCSSPWWARSASSPSCFQWLPAADARSLAEAEPLRTRAGEELADVLLYLVLLADVLGIDLAVAASSKLADAERRFPASG
jgi:hypothetical protein